MNYKQILKLSWNISYTMTYRCEKQRYDAHIILHKIVYSRLNYKLEENKKNRREGHLLAE